MKQCLVQAASVCVLLAAPAIPAGIDWKSLPKEAILQTAPRVEEDAPAEILLKEIGVLIDVDGGLQLSEYGRIKIFSERGREYATVQLPYFNKEKVQQASGRTIKRDGAIREMTFNSIFNRTVIKSNGAKLKEVSFALPDVETGDIVEYYWHARTELYSYKRIEVQADIPTQLVSITIRNKLPGGVIVYPNCMGLPRPAKQTTKGDDGDIYLEFHNLRALRKEPLEPPEDMPRGWLLLALSSPQDLGHRRAVWDFLDEHVKVNSDVRRAAAEITSKGSPAEDKLQKIYEYCHTHIQNTVQSEESQELLLRKENRHPSETLARQAGDRTDINLLFLALARAAGLVARWAKISNSVQGLSGDISDPYFLRSDAVAIRINGQWRFSDPGTGFLPFGMLRWQEQNHEAKLFDERTRDVEWTRTPYDGAAANACHHAAALSLDSDGALEGDVHNTYTGQLALEKRQAIAQESPEQFQKNFTGETQKHWKEVLISNLHIDNRAEEDKPVGISFHLRIPGYASRTGKRLFFQPAVLEAGAAPLLTTKTREQPIYFRYSWTEEDDYTISFPPGYVMDHPDRPAPIAASSVGIDYDAKAFVVGNSGLRFHRRLTSGAGGWRLIPVTKYDYLKKVMEAVQESDNHVMALKQAPEGGR